jgi:hypothetical protein
MEWINQLGGLLQQYRGADAAQPSTTLNDDFDRIAQSAPTAALADGLAAAFRSDQTPDFGQMTGQLFSNSSGHQRASIINTLISAVGPMILARVLSQKVNSSSGGLSCLIGLLSGGQQTPITPEQAEQIPVEAVAEMATVAEKKDPAVIDQISNFYAEHPTLVKTLGATALTIALAKLAERQGIS